MPRWPSVSVVIVGYQSRRHLDACLTAVAGQRYPGRLEVVFVDNDSGDGSAAHVRAAFPAVTVVESAVNLGYAGGNNLGAERAGGEILAFLNPDTVVAPGWLAPLVRALVDDPAVGLATSRILLMDEPETVNACGNEVSLSGITSCRGIGRPAAEFVADADVAAVSGCSFAMRADLFRELGGFDASFFMYLEDTDLSWRARRRGWRCRYVAGSVVHHDFRLAFSPAKVGWIERNRYRMLGRNLSARAMLALAPSLLLAEVLTWGYAAARGPATLAAKARATAGGMAHLARTQRPPASPREGALLREHATRPPVVGEAGGTLGRAVQGVVGPLSEAAARAGLALLAGGPGSADGAGRGEPAGPGAAPRRRAEAVVKHRLIGGRSQ